MLFRIILLSSANNILLTMLQTWTIPILSGRNQLSAMFLEAHKICLNLFQEKMPHLEEIILVSQLNPESSL